MNFFQRYLVRGANPDKGLSVLRNASTVSDVIDIISSGHCSVALIERLEYDYLLDRDTEINGGQRAIGVGLLAAIDAGREPSRWIKICDAHLARYKFAPKGIANAAGLNPEIGRYLVAETNALCKDELALYLNGNAHRLAPGVIGAWLSERKDRKTLCDIAKEGPSQARQILAYAAIPEVDEILGRHGVVGILDRTTSVAAIDSLFDAKWPDNVKLREGLFPEMLTNLIGRAQRIDRHLAARIENKLVPDPKEESRARDDIQRLWSIVSDVCTHWDFAGNNSCAYAMLILIQGRSNLANQCTPSPLPLLAANPTVEVPVIQSIALSSADPAVAEAFMHRSDLSSEVVERALDEARARVEVVCEAEAEGFVDPERTEGLLQSRAANERVIGRGLALQRNLSKDIIRRMADSTALGSRRDLAIFVNPTIDPAERQHAAVRVLRSSDEGAQHSLAALAALGFGSAIDLEMIEAFKPGLLFSSLLSVRAYLWQLEMRLFRRSPDETIGGEIASLLDVPGVRLPSRSDDPAELLAFAPTLLTRLEEAANGELADPDLVADVRRRIAAAERAPQIVYATPEKPRSGLRVKRLAARADSIARAVAEDEDRWQAAGAECRAVIASLFEIAAGADANEAEGAREALRSEPVRALRIRLALSRLEASETQSATLTDKDVIRGSVVPH